MSRALLPISELEGDRVCQMVVDVLRYLSVGHAPLGVPEPTGIAVSPEMRRYVDKKAS